MPPPELDKKYREAADGARIVLVNRITRDLNDLQAELDRAGEKAQAALIDRVIEIVQSDVKGYIMDAEIR